MFSVATRQWILKASALAIIIYSTLVLIYANLIPDLGVETFGRVVSHVRDETITWLDSHNLPIPRKGDVVTRIGGVSIDMLPQYVNTVANLRNLQAQPVGDLTRLPGESDELVLVGGNRYVKIGFQPPDNSGRDAYSSWFPVRDLPWQESAFSVAWFAVESLVFWMGWLVFRRRPEDDASAVFFLMCIVTVGTYMGGYHWLRVASSPGLTFVFALCAMAIPPVSLHFFLLFPNPKRFLLRYPAATLFSLYIVPGLLQVAILGLIGAVVYAFRHDVSGRDINLILELMLWLIGIYLVLAGSMFLGCVACLIHSYRSARKALERQQVGSLLLGAVFAGIFVSYSFSSAMRALAFRDPIDLALRDATWSMFAASLVLTIAFSVSIVRFRLMYVEEILERGANYFLVSFFSGLAYYGLILVAIWFTPYLFSGTQQGEALLMSGFVVSVLVILTTLRSRVQSALDRRFYRSRTQLERAIRRMDEAVGQLIDRESVVHRTLAVQQDVMDCSHAAAYLRTDPGNRLVLSKQIDSNNYPADLDKCAVLVEALRRGNLLQAAPGLALGDSLSQAMRSFGVELAQPVMLHGNLIGALLLGPRKVGGYSSEELGFLTGLTEMTTLALRESETQYTLAKLNDELRNRIDRLSRQRRALTRTADAAAKVDDDETLSQNALHGAGPAMRKMIRAVKKVADSESTVLIRGESGTGKSLLAEVIHRNSPRAAGPFVKVHCGALSPTLLESELFGHIRGAFTGAERDKIGRFEIANGGTLFLDEIGDISLDVQTKLLRVLQERTFERVGSSDSITVDVRIIAATHQPLEDLIARGKIREDLYYRLNVISIQVPPLRERREDVIDLASHFLNNCTARNGNKKLEGFDEEALELLTNYDWPGNVRQLENVVERAVVLADQRYITPLDLPDEVVHGKGSFVRSLPAHEQVASRSDNGNGLPGEIDQFERQRLEAALHEAGGNKSQAAKIVGLPRTTFCSKLKRYGIA